MSRTEQLEAALDSLGTAINRQRARLQADIDRGMYIQGTTPEDLIDTSGQPILAPLLAALVIGLAALHH